MLLNNPPEQQVLGLWNWFYTDLANKDSFTIIRRLQEAEDLFQKKGKELLRQQAWLLQQHYIAGRAHSPKSIAAVMIKASELAGERSWFLTQAECWHTAGNFYFIAEHYGPAFEYMKKAQDVFDQYTAPQYVYTRRYSDALADCYYRFGEYEQAIVYLKKSMGLEPLKSRLYFPSIYNTIGLCYQQLKNYDSAAIWYRKSYKAAAKQKDSFYMALANGNLGYSYYLQGRYADALPLIETDYRVSIRVGERGSAANAAMALASVFIMQGELVKAEQYLTASRPVVYAERNIRLFQMWYDNLYRFYKAKGEFQKAQLYADSVLAYKDSLALQRDKKLFNQTVLKVQTEKYLNEVNQLEARRRQQVLLRNGLLAILILTAIIGLLVVNRRLLKKGKEKELAEQQLQFAREQLISFTQSLKEKNEVVEQLRRQMDIQIAGHDRSAQINQLLSSTILTDDDWKTFRNLFEKVHPGFFIRLKEKMPDLSAADIRLLALTKLQLPPKDMAAMLGVSYEAIKKARQRLRKKINLPEEGSPEELVEMI
jgi:tetratricopeptide (TPR) repeat protein